MLNFETRETTGTWKQTSNGVVFFPDTLTAEELEYVAHEIYLWVDNDGAYYDKTIRPAVERVVKTRQHSPECRIDASLFTPEIERQIKEQGFKLDSHDFHTVTSSIAELMAKYYNDVIYLRTLT